jgi:uncharacterized protein
VGGGQWAVGSEQWAVSSQNKLLSNCQCRPAVPSDVRKGSALPCATYIYGRLCLPPRRSLGFRVLPPERRSLSAHQAAQPLATSVMNLSTQIPAITMLLGAVLLNLSCRQQQFQAKIHTPPPELTETRPLPANSSPQLPLIMTGAAEQVGKTLSYDPSYQSIDYPNGDVPLETGVCTDVIIRAFRKASVDLQKSVHEDMAKNFAAYPTKWGLSQTDANIDHRRVPNLQTYFSRQGKALPIKSNSNNFLPGDVVTWDLGNGTDHVGIVVNVWYKPSKRYLIVHNIGSGARMEDVLFAWKITGHYRYF